MSELTLRPGLIDRLSRNGSPYKPVDWQVDDLYKLVCRDWSANWSEMGCYKTSTGLWLASEKLANKVNPSLLIVTSKSGKGTFFQMIPQLDEFEGWTVFNISTTGISILLKGKEHKMKGLDHLPQKVNFPFIALCHYDVFSRCNKGVPELDPETKKPIQDPETGELKFKPWLQADYIAERHWDMVWCDEFHKLKNKDAKWTVNVKKVKADYYHGSTGTGFINRPDEIWSLLNFLSRYDFSSYWAFRRAFCWEEPVGDGMTVVHGIKPEMVDTFRGLVRSVGVRRTLTEVMPHIKEPIFTRRDVELSPIQKKMYKQIKGELRAMDKNGVPFHSPNVLSALQRLRQICVATPEVVRDYFDEKEQRRKFEIKLTEPSSKLDAFMDVLEELEWDDANKAPVVVFSNFRGPLDLLEKRLTKAKIPYIRLNQEDNEQTRYNKWAVEFPKLKHRVFMATLQLGSESINLTPAHHVVFLDRSWSPKDNSQGIGRIRRPGQEGQPVVINIEAKGTTDQRVEHVNKVKGGWFQEIFGDEDE